MPAKLALKSTHRTSVHEHASSHINTKCQLLALLLH